MPGMPSVAQPTAAQTMARLSRAELHTLERLPSFLWTVYACLSCMNLASGFVSSPPSSRAWSAATRGTVTAVRWPGFGAAGGLRTRSSGSSRRDRGFTVRASAEDGGMSNAAGEDVAGLHFVLGSYGDIISPMQCSLITIYCNRM